MGPWLVEFTDAEEPQVRRLTRNYMQVNHLVVQGSTVHVYVWCRLGIVLFYKESRASLVAQWLRVCLPMQGTRVRALVWEDPTCHGAARPVSHNY